MATPFSTTAVGDRNQVPGVDRGLLAGFKAMLTNNKVTLVFHLPNTCGSNKEQRVNLAPKCWRWD